MAVAAFKSSSRRATSSSSSLKETKEHPTSPRKRHNSSNKPYPPRRSKSVSAVPRSHLETSSDFLIKRDNPLYWSNVSPPDKENHDSLPVKTVSFDGDNRRGRSVSRNADAENNVAQRRTGIDGKDRVDTGRCRSVSRGPVARTHFLSSESDVEQKGLLSKRRNTNDLVRGSNVGKKNNLVRSSSSDTVERIENLQTSTSPSSTNLPSGPNLSWEDGAFASSFSEAEERTGITICEQMKLFQEYDLGVEASSRIYETVQSEVRRAIADIQNDLESAIPRSKATAIATTNVTDIPPDLVNPSAVELVLDIRREYAKKLEQSQERARKLRADLAIEEHRGLELSRILKEVLPDPKMSTLQKSRPGRKSSIERRKMSKRLTEEAMAYFDECVSLSTFDSSDFSSQEDPPNSLVGISAPVSDHASLSQADTNVAASHNSCPNDRQAWGSTCRHDISGQSATSSSKGPILDEISLNNSETRGDRRLQFSFAHSQNHTFEFQHNMGKYVKNFERDLEKVNINSHILRSNCTDLDGYNVLASEQSLLFDTVLFKNKIESGAMLLCGGVKITLLPFSSVV